MIFPMFAMVLLTLVVGTTALRARVASVKTREIDLGYFKLMQSRVDREVPERITVTTRAFNNMFEIPVLFYVVATVALAMDQVTPFTLFVAWGFVLSRCVHSWIHLTYNHILHRMNAYWVGIVLVVALWIEQAILAL